MYVNGNIIHIKDDHIELNIGKNHGINKGEKGIIYITGEIENLTQIIPVATITISSVFEDTSWIKIPRENSIKAGYFIVIVDIEDNFFEMVNHNEKGILLFKKGDIPLSIEEYLLGIEKFPYLPYVFNNLGVAFSSAELIEDAIREYKKALNIKPDYTQAYLNLGRAYEIQEKMDRAIKIWQDALNRNPENITSHYNIKADYVNYVTDEEISKKPPEIDLEKENQLKQEKALEYFRLGMEYFKKEEFREAIEQWEQSLNLYSDFSDVHLNIGTAFKEIGNIEKAKFHYHKAIELNPTEPLTYYNLGLIYYQEENYDRASEEYRKAIEINPDDQDFHYNLGMAYFHLKKLKEAESELKRVIKINPSFGLAYYSLGLVYDEREMLNSSITNYQKALILMPSHVPSHYELGVVYFKKRIFDFAISEWEKVLKTAPENYRFIHSRMGILYEEINNPEKAWKEYELALKYNPLDIEINYRLGKLLMKEGLYEDALFHLEEVTNKISEGEIFEKALHYIDLIEELLAEEQEEENLTKQKEDGEELPEEEEGDET